MPLRINLALFAVLICTSSTAWCATHSLFLENLTTERVVVAHDPRLNPGSAITVEAWLRRNNITSCQTIVGKGFQTGWWFGMCDGRLRYYSRGIGTLQIGNGVVAPNEWVHVAVTFDGTTRRYFINGDLDLEAVTPGLLGNNLRAVGIGGEGSSDTFPDSIFPFSGYMSEVRIWNVARSQEQIRQSMFRQLTTPQPGLVGVWSLENSPDDRFGEFASTLSPGATFSSLDAPPLPHDPLQVPGIGNIVANGLCTDANYTLARSLPAWYDPADRPVGEANPQIILLGANASNLYVCLVSRSKLTDPIYTVEIDTLNQAGNTLQTDDYRFRYWPGGSGLQTFRGNTVVVMGNPVSTWGDPVTNPLNLTASETAGAEFVTDLEMRIPRSIFANPNGLFRLRVGHNFLSGGVQSKTVAWPPESLATRPADWQEMVIDLSLVDAADARNPRVLTYNFASSLAPAAEPVEILAEASDDVDLELLELLIDDVVVESLEFPEADNTFGDFLHSANYPPGLHYYYARAFDHVGRVGTSPLYSFRVVVDGEAPEVRLFSTPHDPAPGQPVTLTAVARDPSGVKQIWVRDTLGTIAPGFRRCDFDGGSETEECSWVVAPAASVRRMRVDALAFDNEGFFNDTPDRIILFGNTGPDTDDDGLADSIEDGLCTNPLNPDTDGDGLSDGWEVEGIRYSLGEVEPLPDYGTNPCFRNVLLQLDYESGTRMPEAAIQNLRNRYRDHRIAVYLEMNERPAATAYPQSHMGAATAAYQLTTDGGPYYFNPRRAWAFYYAYLINRTGRSSAWNRFLNINYTSGDPGYCFGGDKVGERCQGDFQCTGGGTCQSGCGAGPNEGVSCSDDTDCPMPGGDFAECLTPCVNSLTAPGTACTVSGDLDYRLFHELGHTVGMGHGGQVGTRAPSADGGFVTLDNDWNNQNYKPAQLSAMNYFYSRGVVCMNPVPDPVPDGFRPGFVGLVTYIDDAFPTLNENSLPESTASTLNIKLQAQDCSHAGPTAFPVIRYTCETGGIKYSNVSDGNRMIARQAEGGDWDFDPPAHPPGIDFNCDGAITVGGVTSNINGPGAFSETGFFNDDHWDLETNLTADNEFNSIPNPPNCQVLYKSDCEDRAKSCYMWPSSYRTLISPLDTGKAPVDCRAVFLATRSGICGGGSDAEFGTGTCPLVDPDTPLAADSEAARHYSTFSALDGGTSQDLLSHSLANLIETDETEAAAELPGLELCNLQDDDGDGEVDEGCADSDADGVPDVVDNCPSLANPLQEDRDFDGLGEVCQYPAIQDVNAEWTGQSLYFTWSNDSVPRLGVSFYRRSETNPDATYRGFGFPSSEETQFFDDVPGPGKYTYALHVVNLNGEEGDAILVNVTVFPEGVIFIDSYEDF